MVGSLVDTLAFEPDALVEIVAVAPSVVDTLVALPLDNVAVLASLSVIVADTLEKVFAQEPFVVVVLSLVSLAVELVVDFDY